MKAIKLLRIASVSGACGWVVYVFAPSVLLYFWPELGIEQAYMSADPLAVIATVLGAFWSGTSLFHRLKSWNQSFQYHFGVPTRFVRCAVKRRVVIVPQGNCEKMSMTHKST